MAGFSGFKGFGGGGFGGGANIGALMKQAQKIQEDMKKAKEEIENSEFISSVGGGLVEVVMTGNKFIKSIKIKPDIVDKEDIEGLEDLITAAFNDALKQIKTVEEEKLPSIPTGL